MRRLRDPAPEEQPQRRPGEEPTRGLGDPALEAALRRCEARDPSGVSQLWAWQDGRLGKTLERMLDDPQLARQALENVLADLWQNAGGYRTAGVSAEDWVFAHLRLHARDAQRQGLAQPAEARAGTVAAPAADQPFPRPGTPPEPGPATERFPPTPAPGPADPEPTRADSLDATRRVRRPMGAAPAAPSTDGDELYPEQAGGRWRRRLLLVLLWALAGAAGFGLALYTLGGRPPVQESAPRPAPTAPPPAPVEAPAPVAPPPPPERAPAAPAPNNAAPPPPPAPPPAPVEAPPPIRDLIGDPLVAPEPPATVRPLPRPDLGLSPAEPEAETSLVAPVPAPREAAPAPQAAVPGQDRIFIHHRAGDAAGAGLADRLAEELQRRGSGIVVIRSVPFGIGRPSVRYFHAGDRAAAEALVRAARPVFSADGYSPPGAPSDFTDYRPAPRPGTLEIWLPGA